MPCWPLGRFTGKHASVRVRLHAVEVSVGEPTEDPFWALFFAGISAE